MSLRDERRTARVVVRRLHDADRDGARSFWSDVPPHEKLGMAWDMVLEYLAWQQPDVDHQDFSDLFAELNGVKARYLLVGGYTIAVHAEPRFTKDLGIWIDANGDNHQRVYDALGRFGASLQQFSVADLQRPGLVVQIGLPPNRVDVVTSIDGVEFAAAWIARTETTYGKQTVHVIGLVHLIQNKRASGCPQDLADVALLEKQQSP